MSIAILYNCVYDYDFGHRPSKFVCCLENDSEGKLKLLASTLSIFDHLQGYCESSAHGLAHYITLSRISLIHNSPRSSHFCCLVAVLFIQRIYSWNKSLKQLDGSGACHLLRIKNQNCEGLLTLRGMSNISHHFWFLEKVLPFSTISMNSLPQNCTIPFKILPTRVPQRPSACYSICGIEFPKKVGVCNSGP